MSLVKTITKEDIQKAIPSRKNAITDEIADIINKSCNEPEFQGESLLQTAITYEKVMQQNRVGMKDYLNAIRFCSYLISMDDNITEAYKKTFSDRDFVKERFNVSTSDPRYNELTSAASRYRRSRLVTDILTMSQVPLDLLFTGARYKAVGVLAELMVTARQDRDRINAAKELLAATKGPEEIKMELDVGQKTVDLQQQLKSQLMETVAMQKKMLEAGVGFEEATRLGINLKTDDDDDTDFEEAELVDGSYDTK